MTLSSKRPPKPPRPPGAPSSSRPASNRPTEPGAFELPPVPKAPAPKFHSEPPTKQKNVTASVYQSLISVFDTMTPAQRMEFVDVASRYAELDGPARQDFLELLALYPSLWAADRVTLHELAERLASQSGKRK